MTCIRFYCSIVSIHVLLTPFGLVRHIPQRLKHFISCINASQQPRLLNVAFPDHRAKVYDGQLSAEGGNEQLNIKKQEHVIDTLVEV